MTSLRSHHSSTPERMQPRKSSVDDDSSRSIAILTTSSLDALASERPTSVAHISLHEKSHGAAPEDESSEPGRSFPAQRPDSSRIRTAPLLAS
eukprot:CAMPEP_0197179954 /NCGR_PEP_ID=MMETSP1423-20130617/4744_1 /TAXON_ID=476441 /ORGANISM="Pseudo-nitzschia heimii, Strain UNC1101" /LENGTH=92 /DNA_ID=CAMNT_0042629965 /DNA_START=260 /DNA_END=540 /DNA_ORIENTATION=+